MSDGFDAAQLADHPTGRETVAAARAIATIAHHDQVDKLGAAYIEHPGRVAAQLSDPTEVAAAWLHDVIEDTEITAENLLAAGIPAAVVEAVVLLTRTDDVSPADYYAAIRRNPTALAVKLADINDNTAPWRVEQLDPETQSRLAAKYARARALLTDQSGAGGHALAEPGRAG
ncbi:hypothetical protein B7R54_07125 [Subtercola boreus]|uniref:Phosphohydrolase n=1 Tax=Subtercola boreus TaxID=120213 RepID=A0A3E0VH82_9MICO|nr:phosphohydrolase [Subtercola boreus]RFA09019.1 hypothetical protein B7R54_07125 [Subtercola boreus]TQL53981.1 hypothetical protein FB464_1507 [Subtercola boreus]